MGTQRSDTATEVAPGHSATSRTPAPEPTGTSLDFARDAAIAIFTGRITLRTGAQAGPAAGAARTDLARCHRALLRE
ncbi:hypothetical protein ACF1HU_19575 [Streptomyces olivaceus]|uniref:hypothetical protein n=1 Tax=Streptomyces olivaceus TaxID=47716 RepID=UPI001CC966F5|nr:hypothetical protein [Streptomyces olivaceus]MBZ6286164.1 hypothetical protein [Streptomyces olivaceus]